MSDLNRERIPQHLREIADLLEHERPEATALELDRIKLRAKAALRRPALIGKGNGFMRSRVVSLLVVTGLLGGGSAAMAAAGGPSPFDVLSSNHEGASNSQYCPPSSHDPGKPKKPGPARCGHFPGDDGHGHDGDHHGNGGDPGDDEGNGDDHGQGNGHGYGHEHGNGNGQGYGHDNGHGHGHDAASSQGGGPGNSGGHGNGNAGGHGNGGGKGGGKHH
jgi:hypothetical protein